MNLGPVVDRIMVSLKMFRYSPQKRLDRTLVDLKWKGDCIYSFWLDIKRHESSHSLLKTKKKLKMLKISSLRFVRKVRSRINHYPEN